MKSTGTSRGSNDVIVTIRMPATLVQALKSRTADDYYHDLSEQVRSITRTACLRHATSPTTRLANVKEELKRELLDAQAEERASQLLENLKALLAEHNTGDGGGTR